ncbi:hypothetical protein SAMN05216570_1683 [Dyella sp. OK004]|uniref:hypothetical protein n=1 Tax=Dyella sp. OK004 TaxID=1855292 RepID=UPI0008EAF621|nr:hypothetical protein [Dyella sp. OK004]SFS03110.1 hypothetical protein SAMN05216570_1683 [Dyella sp. OK004]
MRQMWFGLGLCALVVMVPGWAADAGNGAKAVPAAGIEQRISKQRAELEGLQHDVAAQEAKSKQADQKMQEQDKTIADLQRQLKEVKAAPTGSATQH